jgi:hemolysin III
LSELLRDGECAPGRSETLNILTHGLGFALSVPAALGLGTVVLSRDDPWRAAGCLAFGVCMVALYGASTMSHIHATRRGREIFRSLDQGCIYLFIVASYTPLSLAYLRTPAWWVFLSALWAIAWLGFASKVFFAHRVEAVSIWIYVALGWAPIIAAPALLSLLPAAALGWMLLGGVCYTLGTLFLVYDLKAHWYHAIWHLLVIAGSACHYYAILMYLT